MSEEGDGSGVEARVAACLEAEGEREERKRRLLKRRLPLGCMRALASNKPASRTPSRLRSTLHDTMSEAEAAAPVFKKRSRPGAAVRAARLVAPDASREEEEVHQDGAATAIGEGEEEAE